MHAKGSVTCTLDLMVPPTAATASPSTLTCAPPSCPVPHPLPLPPSHSHAARADEPRPRSPNSRHRFPKHTFVADGRTGSAVAGTCLRLKVFANFNAREGVIDLDPKEIVK